MSNTDTNPSATADGVQAARPSVIHVPGTVAESPLVERPLPPAFEQLVRHNRSTVVGKQPATISSNAPIGGYVVSFDRSDRSGFDGIEALQVRLRVEKGCVGVGLLDREGASFLNAVDGLKAGLCEVTFLVRGMQHVGPLVVRNAAEDPVVFEWLGASSFLMKDGWEIAKSHVFPEEMAPFAGWNRYYGRFAATAIEGVRQILFEELTAPLVMPWRNGLRIVITPGEETSRALFVSGSYEPASLIALQRHLFPGAVFFDVGANVGVYTLVGSQRVGGDGHVYSFEPSSRERDTLQENVTLNSCSNVTVIAAAVSDRSGTGILRVAAGQHRGQNTLSATFAYPGVTAAAEESVALVALGELWHDRAVRAPNVLKIDAEGSELQVLRGAAALLREAAPVIFFEINDTLLGANGASRAAVEEFLTGLGYALHRIDEATATLIPITTLSGVESENFVAVPRQGTR